MRGVFRVEPIEGERREFELFPGKEEEESEFVEETEAEEEDEEDEENGFLLDREDWRIVRGLKKVLWQLARSSKLSSARQLEAVAGVLGFLEELPRAEREEDIEISLHGRRQLHEPVLVRGTGLRPDVLRLPGRSLDGALSRRPCGRTGGDEPEEGRGRGGDPRLLREDRIKPSGFDGECLPAGLKRLRRWKT